MQKLSSYLLVIILLPVGKSFAQVDTQSISRALRNYITVLASDSMQGRGYVNGGRERAAAFIQGRFAALNMQPVAGKDSYLQAYSFPVNTFPGKMTLSINDHLLKAGDDYLVDAASPSCAINGLKVKKVALGKVRNSAKWQRMLERFDGSKVWYLENYDMLCKTLGIRPHDFTAQLPKGCYIIPEKAKLTWTVSRTQNKATVFYVKKESLPRHIKTVNAEVLAKLEPESANANIVAEIPGTIKDSFIVFSAHYDHLGKMGEQAIFPGASDNASGTAMMLYLASYYATHKQKYSMLFIAFSGEEAGLLGSQFFVSHPLVPLGSIKFLTNIDIMGNANNGVTVVNATEYPAQFKLLTDINEEHKYLQAVKSRGKAANSDHYYFSEAGVPAFFMYSNGGQGHYHDIFDTADEISLFDVTGVARLLIDFVNALN